MAKNNKLLKFIFSAILIAALGFAAFMINQFKPDAIPVGKMYVDFIDVGQGDCTLISTSDAVILIDAGEAENANHIVDFLKNKGIEKIDYCIATHPHSDHIGALPTVFKHIRVDTVIVPEIPDDLEPTTKAYEDFLEGLEYVNNIMFAIPGDIIEHGSLEIEFFGPVKEYDDLNLMSIVSKVTFGETSVMLTGDTEVAAEKDMLNIKGADYSADILKVAHHGSKTSSSKKWLKAVDPDYAVISCGLANDYNHPHDETLDNLDDFDVEYYRTDLLGDISFESDGKNFTYIKN